MKKRLHNGFLLIKKYLYNRVYQKHQIIIKHVYFLFFIILVRNIRIHI